MIFDFLKHKCCFCKKREDLTKVEHPAYHITYSYFHESCLQRVLSNPEKNQNYVDTAIQIADRLKELSDENQEKNLKALDLKNRLYKEPEIVPVSDGMKEPVVIKNRFEILKGN